MHAIGMNEIHMMAGALDSDRGGDESERRGEAVAGRGRRDADDGGRREPEGAGPSAPCSRPLRPSGRRRIGGHASPLRVCSATVRAIAGRGSQRQAQVLLHHYKLRLEAAIRFLQAAICNCVGQRTSVAQPARSKRRMIAADGSIWWGSAPWRAERGWAWWKLCHASPIDTTPSGAKLVLCPSRSRVGSRTCGRSS